MRAGRDEEGEAYIFCEKSKDSIEHDVKECEEMKERFNVS